MGLPAPEAEGWGSATGNTEGGRWDELLTLPNKTKQMKEAEMFRVVFL